jgi:hydrogenase nickel incorporation protein HypA/HybF
MHEWGITQAVIDEVAKQAAQNNIKKVNYIKVKLGEGLNLSSDSFMLAFETLSKNSIMEGAKVEIETDESNEAILKTIEGD